MLSAQYPDLETKLGSGRGLIQLSTGRLRGRVVPK